MTALERRPTGVGARTALIVVDAINAFTDPACPLGFRVDAEIGILRRCLAFFRKQRLPVCYTTQVYSSPEQASVWREKLPALAWLTSGTQWVAVDSRVAPRDSDAVIVKLGPSAFFETELKARLLRDGVDSVFVAGFTTSGCVRATAVDAVSGNFRTVVLRDACADRDASAHLANLYDLEAKYADVLPADRALDLLKGRQSHARGQTHLNRPRGESGT